MSMNTYQFFQKVKVSIWKSIHFEINADNEEEAINKIAELKDVVYYDSNMEHVNYDFGTEHILSPEENNGGSTIKTCGNDGNVVFENGTSSIDSVIIIGDEACESYDNYAFSHDINDEYITVDKLDELKNIVGEHKGMYYERSFRTISERNSYLEGVEDCVYENYRIVYLSL